MRKLADLIAHNEKVAKEYRVLASREIDPTSQKHFEGMAERYQRAADELKKGV